MRTPWKISGLSLLGLSGAAYAMGGGTLECPQPDGRCVMVVTVARDPKISDETKNCRVSFAFKETAVSKGTRDLTMEWALKKADPAGDVFSYRFDDGSGIKITSIFKESKDFKLVGGSFDGQSFRLISLNQRQWDVNYGIGVWKWVDEKRYKCNLFDPRIKNAG